jgi:putative ABC transport system permease protein
MLRQDVIFALRSLARRPLQSTLRVAVLALGLFAFLLSYLVVAHFRSYDRQWAKADRTYAIFESLDWPTNRLHVPMAPNSTPLLAEQLRLDVPELESAARYRQVPEAFIELDGGTERPRQVRTGIAVADAELLDVFDFEVVAGDLRGALSRPDSAIVTDTAAQAWFGTDDAVGKRVTVVGYGSADVTIAAVIRQPRASHIGEGLYSNPFSLLVPWDLWGTVAPPNAREPNWFTLMAHTYVVLPRDGALGVGELDRRLRKLLTQHAPSVPGLSVAIETRPVSAITTSLLQNSFQFYRGGTWFLDLLDILLLFAGVVLAVACVNFVNLETGSAAGRTREIGIRKSMGAKAAQVVLQDLARTGILVGAGTAIAVAVVPLVRGALPDRWRPAFAVPWSEPHFWIFLAALVLAVTVLAGLYPALVLSRIGPLDALRLGGRRAGSKVLRALLVGTQFATATFLLTAVVVLYAERGALREAVLGNLDDQYVVVTTPQQAAIDPEVLSAELMRGPGIRSVTGIVSYPFAYTGSKLGFGRTAGSDAPAATLDLPMIGYDYFEVMNVPVLAGRAFSRDRADIAPLAPAASGSSPASGPTRVVLDRRAARALGFANPSDAVGQTLYASGQSDRSSEIVGVVEDAPISIRSTGSEGVLYRLNPAMTQYAIVRIAKDDVPASLAHIDNVLKALAPNNTLVRRQGFLDELFDSLYDRFAAFAAVDSVMGALAAFAIAVAGIGLVGLASDMTARRTREIAVRKSQGARSAQVVRLLLFDFLKPVLAANLIAWPFIYFAAARYLDAFSVRIALTPVPFLLALATTVAVAVLAVGGRVLYAASIKPAKALRHE